jgi:hypothetical protein
MRSCVSVRGKDSRKRTRKSKRKTVFHFSHTETVTYPSPISPSLLFSLSLSPFFPIIPQTMAVHVSLLLSLSLFLTVGVSLSQSLSLLQRSSRGALKLNPEALKLLEDVRNRQL